MCIDVSDDELIAAYRGGDLNALEQLVGRHLAAVWSLASQLMLCQARADDLAQESMLRVIRGLGGFRTWLFRIVVNTSHEMRARSQRDGVDHSDSQQFDPIDPSHDGPEHLAMRTEMEQGIALAVEGLPLNLRTALVLTTLHDFSPQDVAEMEGCAVNTIYWRIHEARKLLRKAIGAMDLMNPTNDDIDLLLHAWARQHAPSQEHLATLRRCIVREVVVTSAVPDPCINLGG